MAYGQRQNFKKTITIPHTVLRVKRSFTFAGVVDVLRLSAPFLDDPPPFGRFAFLFLFQFFGGFLSQKQLWAGKKKQKKIVVRHRKRRGGVKERKISFIKKFHFCCNDTTSDLKRGVGVGTRVENRIQADNWGQHDDNNRVIINTFGIRRK